MSIAELAAPEKNQSSPAPVPPSANEAAAPQPPAGPTPHTTSTGAASDAPPARPKAEAGSEGLSQFLARVLDQLSISSWLPSGVLVAGTLLYVGLTQHKADLGSTLTSLVSVDVAQLALGIGLVVLATVATQAFEFRAIRTLEGYWGPGRVKTWLIGRLCGQQLRRKGRLEKRMGALRSKAVVAAAKQMTKDELKPEVIEAFLAEENPQAADPQPEVVEALPPEENAQEADPQPDDVAAAPLPDWRDFAPLSKVRGYFAVGQHLERFPAERRHILPTRLGNVLRSHELAADDGEGDLEGLAQRLYARVPGHLQLTHDNFRSRLDLYCTMVFVLLGGALAAPLLAWTDAATAWLAGGVSFSLSILCYRAAIASADGYGQVLRSMANHVRKADAQVN